MEIICFQCKGHPNILATHKSTIEIIIDSELSTKGNCIIGVESTLNLPQFPERVKTLIKNEKNSIKINFNINGTEDIIYGRGHPNLLLSDSKAIILRTSNYICPKTLMISSNKAARDISRVLVNQMKKPETRMKVTVSVHEGSRVNSKQA